MYFIRYLRIQYSSSSEYDKEFTINIDVFIDMYFDIYVVHESTHKQFIKYTNHEYQIFHWHFGNLLNFGFGFENQVSNVLSQHCDFIIFFHV